jgi:hypothetical protein
LSAAAFRWRISSKASALSSSASPEISTVHGVGHQITDNRNDALTLRGMLVRAQDDGGFPQGAQIAHDLNIRALTPFALARSPVPA